MLRLSHLAAARATGKDAGSFLQAQLTADLTRLADGGACFSAYCEPTGNVIALIRVIRVGDDYMLITSASLLDRLLLELRKYVLRAAVTFERLPLPVIGNNDNGNLSYALATDRADLDVNTAEDLETWRAAELRQGVCWLGPESSGRFLPQMLGLDQIDAISFRKGCFPGQEVIARVRYLGKSKRLPMIAEIAGETGLSPGIEVSLECAGDRSGSGEVVDLAHENGRSVVFVLARRPQGAKVTAIESEGRHLPLVNEPG